MTRPLNYGRAGILSIFCTQSNDFAIGSPIVNALYHVAHPEYNSYLYLMAPLSLAILNPIGLVLLEISTVGRNVPVKQDEVDNATGELSQSQTVQPQTDKKVLLIKALKSIIFNPILFMTVFGVIGGFSLQNGLPDIIAGVLKVYKTKIL